jgi:hypothetical protein
VCWREPLAALSLERLPGKDLSLFLFDVDKVKKYAATTA